MAVSLNLSSGSAASFDVVDVLVEVKEANNTAALHIALP